MEPLILKIYKTHKDNQLPKFATDQSACFDLMCQMADKKSYKTYAKNNKARDRISTKGEVFVGPGERVMIPTGLIFDIPRGYSIRVHARSGLALKNGISLANAEGIVDSDFTDEGMILIVNTSENGITFFSGDRIAQAELVKELTYEIAETKTMPSQKTDRISGFGSTGTDSPVPIAAKRGPGRPKIIR